MKIISNFFSVIFAEEFIFGVVEKKEAHSRQRNRDTHIFVELLYSDHKTMIQNARGHDESTP